MRTEELKTPVYLIDEGKIKRNLEILKDVIDKTGCKILLAQKAFSAFKLYPLIGEYLSGATASGLYEARLAHEEMGKENHVYCPAYKDDEMQELVKICDHIIFNSVAQYEKYKWACKIKSCGLRINPEYSTCKEAIYDPCAKRSRLGIRKCDLDKILIDGKLPSEIQGLHIHTLCEQGFEELHDTFRAFEKNFGHLFYNLKWLNLGGGHHITKEGYNVDGLINLIREIKEKYKVDVYLEPGEAIALNAGYLLTEVMDIVHNETDILIVDASAACHMPDVLEMPYRPPLLNSGLEGEKKYSYRIGSRTCLSGDIIGDYSFDNEIKIGDRLVFLDMAIYSMVKNNTFNGMPLPDIAVLHENGDAEVIKSFSYSDFKERLS